MKMENQKYKKLILYSLMFDFIVLFLIFTGEILVRFTVPLNPLPPPPPAQTIDPYTENPYIVQVRPYIFAHIPHAQYNQARSTYEITYKINSLGFRGDEIPAKNKLKRLVVVGDSIVEGHGNALANTFPYLLDEQLRPSNWEVLNMGMQGASPIYYATNLQRYLAVSPDAVLIMIYENDIFDDHLREETYFNLPFLDDDSALLGKNENLLALSKLYVFLRNTWRKHHLSPIEQIIAHNNAQRFTAEELAVREEFEKFKKNNNLFIGTSTHLIAPSLFDTYWRKSQTYLDYLVENFRQRNIPVLIANLSVVALDPSAHPIYRKHAQTLDEKVSTWTKAENLPFLSLLPTLLQAIEENPPFITGVVIQDDGHPNAKTHAKIAESLKPFIIQELKIKNQ